MPHLIARYRAVEIIVNKFIFFRTLCGPSRAVMYGARQRPSHLICGLCPSITDTTFALQFPHMLIIHAVLEHDVSLEDVARSANDCCHFA
jgi:hypothetical protein